VVLAQPPQPCLPHSRRQPPHYPIQRAPARDGPGSANHPDLPACGCREVPLNSPITVEGVRVTFLEANHCPGAVMMLFEPPGRRPVLHTGWAGGCSCGWDLRGVVGCSPPCCMQARGGMENVGLSDPRPLPVPACPAGDCRLIPEMQQEEALAAVRYGTVSQPASQPAADIKAGPLGSCSCCCSSL
jgi:hypothetical protein